jgi:hypothetical protein
MMNLMEWGLSLFEFRSTLAGALLELYIQCAEPLVGAFAISDIGDGTENKVTLGRA